MRDSHGEASQVDLDIDYYTSFFSFFFFFFENFYKSVNSFLNLSYKVILHGFLHFSGLMFM